MTYFHAESVQLIVSRSDSELEVQRYGMKKNTLAVDSIVLQDELWMRQCEKLSPNCRSRFFENWTAETEFLVFEFWGQFSSVFRKPISNIFTPYKPLGMSCDRHLAKMPKCSRLAVANSCIPRFSTSFSRSSCDRLFVSWNKIRMLYTLQHFLAYQSHQQERLCIGW